MDNRHRILIRLDNTGDVPLPTFAAREDVGDGTAWVTVPATDSPLITEKREGWQARLEGRYGEGNVPYPPVFLEVDPLPILAREGDRMVLIAHGEATGRTARRRAEAKAAADALAAFLATA